MEIFSTTVSSKSLSMHILRAFSGYLWSKLYSLGYSYIVLIHFVLDLLQYNVALHGFARCKFK